MPSPISDLFNKLSSAERMRIMAAFNECEQLLIKCNGVFLAVHVANTEQYDVVCNDGYWFILKEK